MMPVHAVGQIKARVVKSTRKLRVLIPLLILTLASISSLSYLQHLHLKPPGSIQEQHPADVNQHFPVLPKNRLLQNSSDSKHLKHTGVCVEPNICKKSPDDMFYIYNRRGDFLDRVDAHINDSVSTEHTDFVVPNIVHFVQYTDLAMNRSQNQFEFHHMVSLLSVYKFQKPERIYFWLDKEPVGKYWNLVKNLVPMFIIIRERPTSIRGRKIHLITKISNVIRLEAIIEYGGIYIDLDVIVVKSFDPLRKFDAMMGKEGKDLFCNAVLVGRPWSAFFRLWHQEHKSLDESRWNFHSGKVPYYLSELRPSLIHVEGDYFFRPGYYEMESLYKEGVLYDWRRRNYCVHLWIRLYQGKRVVDSDVNKWNTTLGEIYRTVLFGDSRLIP